LIITGGNYNKPLAAETAGGLFNSNAVSKEKAILFPNEVQIEFYVLDFLFGLCYGKKRTAFI